MNDAAALFAGHADRDGNDITCVHLLMSQKKEIIAFRSTISNVLRRPGPLLLFFSCFKNFEMINL